MSLVHNKHTEINTRPAILVTLHAACIYYEGNGDSDLYCNLKVKFDIFGDFCYCFLRVFVFFMHVNLMTSYMSLKLTED